MMCCEKLLSERRKVFRQTTATLIMAEKRQVKCQTTDKSNNRSHTTVLLIKEYMKELGSILTNTQERAQ